MLESARWAATILLAAALVAAVTVGYCWLGGCDGVPCEGWCL
jgi:hypothetical protein